MSYVHKPSLEPLDHRTPMQLFDIHANLHPEREAFVLYDDCGKRSSYTFKEMQQKSLFLAASFLKIGWKRGQRVVIMIPNRIEFLESYMALLRIGVTAVLVPPFGTRFEQLSELLESLKSQGIVLCASKNNPVHKNLIECLDTLFESTKVVWLEAHAELPQGKYSHYDDLLKAGQLLDVKEVLKEQCQVQMDDPAVMMFTSGSTGLPKGIQHSNHLLVNSSIIGGVYGCGLDDKDVEYRIFTDRPFYWAGCQALALMFGILMGCTIIAVNPKKSIKEGDIDYVLGIIQKEKCTNALLMPYTIIDINNHADINRHDISSLKTTYTTGQPIHPSHFTKLRSRLPNCRFYKSYGMTEYLLIAYQEHDSSADESMNLLPGNEMKIVNEDKQLVPIGQVGEICIRSPVLNHISSTGWARTGDMGFLNHEKRLTISGRCADMIKQATLKIFPAAVEKVIALHPDVEDVIVVGVPDERLYEALCACVIAKENSILDNDSTALEEWLSRQWTADETGLSMKPKHLLIMKEFPKTNTGKTDRKAVKITAMQRLHLHYME